jgi:hypothetical protein
VQRAVEEKRRYIAAGATSWPDPADWDSLRARIGVAIEPFTGVEAALEAAAVPGDPGYPGVDRRTLWATFRYASRLRARYTVIDFLEGQGVIEPALEEMLGAATSGPRRGAG